MPEMQPEVLVSISMRFPAIDRVALGLDLSIQPYDPHEDDE